MIEVEATPQVALVIHPSTRLNTHQAQYELSEAVGLAQALGVDVAYSEIVPLRAIKVGAYFGSGKIAQIKEQIGQTGANLVIINASLTPIQQRNLELIWQAKVLDRTGMILEIFALRAATKEGRLQVELARLGYERSRLVRTWTHLERQRGGQGFLAGPGETQIESDRRVLAEKITKLNADLELVRKTRSLQRSGRKRSQTRTVALVGYTNAGKSTLFNALTQAGVMAKDMLFATLDTTHRILNLPNGQEAILSDTVGFISDLPTDLINAFRATLEEIKEADLLIHVRDIADELSEERKQDVLNVLNSIGAGPQHEQDTIEVWNKIDNLNMDEKDSLPALVNGNGARASQQPDIYPVSSRTREGLPHLLTGIEHHLSKHDETINVVIFPQDAAGRAWLYQHGSILSDEQNPDGSVHVIASLSKAMAGRFFSQFPDITSKNNTHSVSTLA